MTRLVTWQKIGSQSWRATWTGTGPYQVVLAGKVLIETEDTEYLFDGHVSPPPVEVVDMDAGDVAQTTLYPPYAVIRWRGVQEASYYRIYKNDEFVDIAIEERRGYYRWEDVSVDVPTTHSYKVTAVDVEENESDPIEIVVFVVGIPGRPEQFFEYDSGTGDVTVTVSV